MEAVSVRRWQLREGEFSEPEVENLAKALGLSPLCARVLRLRGILGEEDGRQFLESRLSSLPDPFLLSGMEAAVERLLLAIEKKEMIAVHGDYDVDGITGTTLLVESLRSFGASVDYHIPLRLRDGYGLSAEALREAAGRGVAVVVSVDCGVSAVEEANLARQLGLDLIVTDHHQAPDPLPEAYAIINPHQPGCPFPFKELSGVGVAFFLLVALRKALREAGAFAERPEPDLRHCLDLVALGTIADIVPLKGVNRALTSVGLSVLERGGRAGVRSLKEVAAVKEVNCGAVGFRLAPRLNAAGRLEDAGMGVELLLESSEERAKETARLLDSFNAERQAIEKETLRQAIERLEERGEGGEKSIVLADERWHSGVIGIVASRLVERYHRPTFLIALDGGAGKGSGRSIKGFDLYEALQGCSAHLAGFGGHRYAAGLSVDAGNVDAFAEAFEFLASQRLSEEDLLPILPHDGEVLLEELSMEVVKELSVLAPFGAGNPEPVFIARAISIHQVRPVGESHLRFTARQDGYSISCIAFGMAERAEELEGEVDLLFNAGVNEWRGDSSVQLRIKDFRETEE